MKHFLAIILTLAACFGAQALALRAMGGRTTKSESNYFSSVGRIQAAASEEAAVLLLGSSITGRLPDRANGFAGFANMGCDGGSAVDALRAIDAGLLPVAPVLVVETNTLHLALAGGSSEVGRAMRSPWFQVGTQAPLLSAYARPSAFAYSALLARKIGGFGDPEAGPDLGVSSGPVRLAPPAADLDLSRGKVLAEELVPLLQRLRAKGCRIVFVDLPPAGPARTAPEPWLHAIIASSGTEWWNLGGQIDPAAVVLTDGVHMDAPSAGATVRSLEQGL
jgi:hypothetical protein